LDAGVKIQAIVDIILERAEMKAKKYSIPKVFTSHEEMLKSCPEITLISVCVPNKFHYNVAVDSLNAGKNVMCEKPPAINAMQTEKMKETAEKNKRILMFNFNNRARPESQVLMKYIKNGEIGRINSAQALWIRKCGIPGFGGWFTQKALAGGGCTIDLIHGLDLALYFMGYPEPSWVLSQVFYDFSMNPDFKGPWGFPDMENAIMDVETASQAFIRFKTGEVLFSRSSWAELNEREEVSVTFQGTKAGGSIKRLFGIDGIDETAIDTCKLFSVENGNSVSKSINVIPDEKMGRETSVKNFVNTVRGKATPLSNPNQAVTLMKIVDAIYESAKADAPVKIE